MRRSTLRFGVCSVALVATMVLGDRRVHDIVVWWPALMTTAVVILLTAAPPPSQWAGLVDGLRAAGGTTRPVECNTMKETVGAGQRRA